MGRLQAEEMRVHADLDTALYWHLTANHYPPLPAALAEACKQAIDLANAEDWDAAVKLPEGISHRRYGTQVPVAVLVDELHLEAFLGPDDDEIL